MKTEKPIPNEEQIREHVRRVLNKILDEEYDNIMKELEGDKEKLASRGSQIIERILLSKEEGDEENPAESI